MTRKMMTLFILVATLALIGCKRDDEINAVVKELDSFTTQLVQTADQAGPDAAQQFLTTKGKDMKKKIDSIKSVRGFQISAATKQAMTAGFSKNVIAVAGLQIRHMQRSVRDPNYKAKLDKLINDYKNMLIA
jgi:hypothetical protein